MLFASAYLENASDKVIWYRKKTTWMSVHMDYHFVWVYGKTIQLNYLKTDVLYCIP